MAQSFIIRDEAMRERAIDLIRQLAPGKPWKVSVAPYKRNRSLEQNNLYHSWLDIIARETGNSHDDMHEFCKGEFLSPRFVEVSGRTREIAPSTASLKVDEMSTYMNQVYAWATSELGLLLPIPEELGRDAA